jgi:hypothetical protein
MNADSLAWITSAWHRMRVNDIPNWIVVLFTAILWPVVLILWHRRKVDGVSGLEVHFADGKITNGGQLYAAVDI